MKKRDEEGSYNMVKELAVGNREMYFKYMRMASRVARISQGGGGLFLKFDSTVNELDPNFH